MLNNTVEIAGLTMVPVKVPASYRRKTNIEMDVRAIDKLGEQYQTMGVGGITSDFMSRNIGGAVSYDNAPTEVMGLPNGNDIERFTFKIISRSLESQTPDYTVTAEYIITGYTDNVAMSFNGTIDDNMVLYFTNLSGTTYTQHRNGQTNSRRIMNSEILRNPTTDMLHRSNNHMRMSAQDVLVGLAIQQHNGGELSERSLMVNTLGDNTSLSSHTDNNPFETIAASVSGHIMSDVEEDNLLTNKADTFINAANRASGATLRACPFMQKIMLDTGIPGVSAITWGDLKYSFPDIETKTEVFTTNNIEQSPTNAFLNGNDAGAASLLTATATMAVDLVLAKMVLFNISTINFTMSNMTLTGETTYAITGVTTPRVVVDNQTLMQLVDKFLGDYAQTSFQALTKGIFNISLSVVLTQVHATVSIEIDGYGTDTIVIPIVSHTLQAPTLATTQEYAKNVGEVGTIIDLVNTIPDAGVMDTLATETL